MYQTMLSNKILKFFTALNISAKLPTGVEVLNPYHDPVTFGLCQQFYKKYYSDDHERTLILGINPGRFGGGVTGIPFTDPIRLETECGISNDLSKKPELSSDYIYRMITAFGGPNLFYSQYYIGSCSPLGFTKAGLNLNYYDDRELEKKITPFIIESLQTQLGFGIRRDKCFCLGEGENFKFLTRLNVTNHFFERIVPLSHPRFIMQYRRKKIDQYIADYLTKLGPASG